MTSPPKIIPCAKGFVGKRSGVAGQPDYLDRGGEWMPSAGGPPECVATKPFATREKAEVGIKERAAKDAMPKNAENPAKPWIGGGKYIGPTWPMQLLPTDLYRHIERIGAERRLKFQEGIAKNFKPYTPTRFHYGNKLKWWLEYDGPRMIGNAKAFSNGREINVQMTIPPRYDTELFEVREKVAQYVFGVFHPAFGQFKFALTRMAMGDTINFEFPEGEDPKIRVFGNGDNAIALPLTGDGVAHRMNEFHIPRITKHRFPNMPPEFFPTFHVNPEFIK